MPKNPLVSILIPAYNAELWLTETLRSAVGQTWRHREIIVVDDGSTDRTAEIARQFEGQGVTVFTQKNQGAAAARNKAFELSRGDYIQWLDADDLLGADKIERQVAALDGCSPRTLLSSEWGRFLYRYERAKFVPSPLWGDMSPAEWLLRKMGQNLHMQTGTWLVSRELTQAAGPWNTTLLGDDDGEYFCRVLIKSDGVRFVPGARVFYRMAGVGSLSYIGMSDRKMEAQFRSMKMHIGYLRSLDDSARARAACVAYLQTWLVEFYPGRLDIVQESRKMAAGLGGRLEVPQLSWKYSWIDRLFGRPLAKRAQVYLPRVRWSLVRFWDRTLFRLTRRDSIPASA